MLRFRVADFLFEVETRREEVMHRRMANYHPFEVQAGDDAGERPLFRISLDDEVSIPECEPLKSFAYDLTEDTALLRIYDNRYILSITSASGHEFLLDCPMTKHSEGAEYRFHCNVTTRGVAPSPHILDHFIIFAFSLAMADRRGLFIHASTVVYGGKAVMFLAESGTGKSTHTQLWLNNISGAALLNDDAPILRVDGGKVTAYGTPWSGKLACYKNEKYPLAACVRIRRAPYNRIERISSISAFGALLPSCLPTLQQRDEMLDSVCETLSEVLPAVPVYTLDCLPDADAARTSYEAIFGKN